MQVQDVLSRAERMNALMSHWQTKVRSSSDRGAFDVIKYFAVNSYITTKKFRRILILPFQPLTELLKSWKMQELSPKLPRESEIVFTAQRKC